MHLVLIAGMIMFMALFYFKFIRRPKIVTQNSVYEREVSAAEFDNMVVKTSAQTPVLVDFYAPWCEPCQAFTPLLSELVAQYQGGFLLAKVNVEKYQQLSNDYGIEAMPTVMLFKGGKIVEQFSGGKLEHSLRYILSKHGIEELGGPVQSRPND
ncbi:MAG: thioredoxin domain-containing protein [Cellvibrionaceae bacterium]|nr:thioredoxin domain-containing protein [Cellvibrionaceae bacterium]MCV6625604.1 thioredoxin domain-containing protein [Cellvibrionaceae bacterium]